MPRALQCGRGARAPGPGTEPQPFPLDEGALVQSIAPLDAEDEEAACAPGCCTRAGCANVSGPALAAAKGPVRPWGMTPITVASACARWTGFDPRSLARWSMRSLVRWLRFRWQPARHWHGLAPSNLDQWQMFTSLETFPVATHPL